MKLKTQLSDVPTAWLLDELKKRGAALDVISRLGITIEEAEEMIRAGLMWWAIGAQVYGLLWSPTRNTP